MRQLLADPWGAGSGQAHSEAPAMFSQSPWQPFHGRECSQQCPYFPGDKTEAHRGELTPSPQVVVGWVVALKCCLQSFELKLWAVKSLPRVLLRSLSPQVPSCTVRCVPSTSRCDCACLSSPLKGRWCSITERDSTCLWACGVQTGIQGEAARKRLGKRVQDVLSGEVVFNNITLWNNFRFPKVQKILLCYLNSTF